MPDQSGHLLALFLRAIGHGSSIWPSNGAKLFSLITLRFVACLIELATIDFLMFIFDAFGSKRATNRAWVQIKWGSKQERRKHCKSG